MLSDSRSEIISKLSVFSSFSFFFGIRCIASHASKTCLEYPSLWQKSGDRVARAAETEL